MFRCNTVALNGLWYHLTTEWSIPYQVCLHKNITCISFSRLILTSFIWSASENKVDDLHDNDEYGDGCNTHIYIIIRLTTPCHMGEFFADWTKRDIGPICHSDSVWTTFPINICSVTADTHDSIGATCVPLMEPSWYILIFFLGMWRCTQALADVMILYSRRFLNSRPLETPEGVRAAPIPTIRWVTYHTCRYPECVMPTKSVPCSTISDHTSNSVNEEFHTN